MIDAMRIVLALPLMLALAACDGGHASSVAPKNSKERTMSDLPDLPQLRANLAFTCAYEKDHIPSRDPEADQLYQYARWLQKNNALKRNPEVLPRIERLVRIATAYGHDKANLELRNMIAKGDAYSDDPRKETIDLTEDLTKRGIPGGYYDMAGYLESGYGVKQDEQLARKYMRKAADLGSPAAQYAIGDRLTGFQDPTIQRIGEAMWQCAAEQGHGEAAQELGIWLSGDGRYAEALKAFQLGVKAGDALSALALESGFNGPKPDDRINYLGQHKDEERVRRYEAIGHVLSLSDYLHPKVPEIDEIVPLPPAKLPPWDGKLKWVEAHKANVPPPLPSEERIVEMAKAKGLDPLTGWPLKQKVSQVVPVESKPESVADAPAVKSPLGMQLATGALCPLTGTWVCSPQHGGGKRVFVAGETLSGVRVAAAPSLWQKLKGEEATEVVETTWTLIDVPESNQA